MAGRYLKHPMGRTGATYIAAFLLSAMFVGTAAASSNLPAECPKARKILLEIPASELHASTASHEFDVAPVPEVESDALQEPVAPGHYPAPKIDAALRRVFDSDAETDPEPLDDPKPAVGTDEQPAIKARVPGISDTDLARYKRHMYRRDI
ncbi:MAG: hypothetical protein ACR2QZ_09920 [Woeseiaceae bacterium]